MRKNFKSTLNRKVGKGPHKLDLLSSFNNMYNLINLNQIRQIKLKCVLQFFNFLTNNFMKHPVKWKHDCMENSILTEKFS